VKPKSTQHAPTAPNFDKEIADTIKYKGHAGEQPIALLIPGEPPLVPLLPPPLSTTVLPQLTIVDTPGFGDNINNEFECVCMHTATLPINLTCRFQEIVAYLEHQYDDILAEESHIKRNPRFHDNHVHVLLYFIPSTGHSCVPRFQF
jgi:hypothetical protein